MHIDYDVKLRDTISTMSSRFPYDLSLGNHFGEPGLAYLVDVVSDIDTKRGYLEDARASLRACVTESDLMNSMQYCDLMENQVLLSADNVVAWYDAANALMDAYELDNPDDPVRDRPDREDIAYGDWNYQAHHDGLLLNLTMSHLPYELQRGYISDLARRCACDGYMQHRIEAHPGAQAVMCDWSEAELDRLREGLASGETSIADLDSFYAFGEAMRMPIPGFEDFGSKVFPDYIMAETYDAIDSCRDCMVDKARTEDRFETPTLLADAIGEVMSSSYRPSPSGASDGMSFE